MIRRILFTIFLTGLVAASDQIPGAVQQRPVLLRNGTIHTVVGAVLPRTDILFRDGKISAIGKNLKAFPEFEVIDISGKQVYPGLIAASTPLGLVEIDEVRATVDITEVGDLNPNIIANRAYNPDSEAIPVTRSNGVLLANVTPQGTLLAGQSSLMQLDGWTWEDATLSESSGMHLTWPAVSAKPWVPDGKTVSERLQAGVEKIRLVDDLLADARAYERIRTAETAGQRTASQKRDLRLESLLPVIQSRMPVFIHAHEAAQIEQAVNWSRRQGLKMILVGGHDAALLTGLLKSNNIPVILESVLVLPLKRQDGYDQLYRTPLALHQAGIRFALAASPNGFDAPHQRNLPYEAGMAAAFGLPATAALRAITLGPAEILGVADRVGSLAVGKDATLFIADGDILDIRTQVEQAWIQGRRVDLDDRHKQLYRKYREKYRQMGILE
ncbi:MAG: amidohydrolase family protein [Candidatus Neomarinimicrobiota bacterium]